MQQAFIEEQAAQCGYCIPGIMMRAQALLQKNMAPSDEEILRAHGAATLPVRHAYADRESDQAGGQADADGLRRERYREGRLMTGHPLETMSRRAVLRGTGALVLSFSSAARLRKRCPRPKRSLRIAAASRNPQRIYPAA